MKQLWLIAAEEWRYWLRSHLALSGALIFIVLIVATSILTTLRIDAETHVREQQQTQAEETFFAQPDRHPHRMVHYGHYVFRAPTPLAIFDPGLDAVTGQSIFLEGHRQNTVMFPESAASANLGGLSWLTPALVYQLFAPLIIILLGYVAIVREREDAVLTSLFALGVNGLTLVFGKACALLSFVLLLLVPLLLNGGVALVKGESMSAVLALLCLYFMYLVVWAVITLCISVIFHKRSTTLAILTGLWFGFTLVLPSLAVNVATHVNPLLGKIETDLAMLADIRQLGNGHNANDPAFQKLRTELLEKHGVDNVEDLPMNFRGLVAMDGERKLTDVLNKYAQSRMANEMQQEELIAQFAWLTPTLAIAFASRAIAGTDLAHYHRFQEEAEALRYKFVQGLNRSHAEKLSYQDDMNRNNDAASWKRAKVGASNWQVLDAYQFHRASISERFTSIYTFVWVLLTWLIAVFCILLLCSRRTDS